MGRLAAKFVENPCSFRKCARSATRPFQSSLGLRLLAALTSTTSLGDAAAHWAPQKLSIQNSPKSQEAPRAVFANVFSLFWGVQGCQNRFQNVKKSGSNFTDFLVWISRCIFRDLGSKLDAKLVEFVAKIVVRRNNVHISRKCIFHRPCRCSRGIGPSENI